MFLYIKSPQIERIEQLGWFLMALGVFISTTSLFINVRVLQAGVGIATLGFILARRPNWHLLSFKIGAALFFLMIISRIYGKCIANYPHMPREQTLMGIGVLFYWLLFPISFSVFSNHLVRRLIIIGLIGSILLVSCILLAQVCIGQSADNFFGVSALGKRWEIPEGVTLGRVTQGPLTIGIVLSVGILWLIATNGNYWYTSIKYATIFLGIIALVMLAERSPILGLISGLTIYTIMSSNRREAVWLTITVISLFVFSAVAIAHHRPTAFTELINGENERFNLWRIGLEVVYAHPWFGLGDELSVMSAMQSVANNLNKSIDSLLPHNFFLTIAATYGVPALAIFILFFLSILQHAWFLRSGPILKNGFTENGDTKGKNGNSALSANSFRVFTASPKTNMRYPGKEWRITASIVTCMLVIGWFNDIPNDAASISAFYLALAWAISVPIEQPRL